MKIVSLAPRKSYEPSQAITLKRAIRSRSSRGITVVLREEFLQCFQESSACWSKAFALSRSTCGNRKINPSGKIAEREAPFTYPMYDCSSARNRRRAQNQKRQKRECVPSAAKRQANMDTSVLWKTNFVVTIKRTSCRRCRNFNGYKNVHQIPKVEKVVINTSVGSQSDVKQALEEAKAELALIYGTAAYGDAGEEKHFQL